MLAPAARPDPDPRRTYMQGRLLHGAFWLLITIALTGLLEPLGEYAFLLALGGFVVLMYYHWGRKASDSKMNLRASGDERDTELEFRALKSAFTFTGLAACVLCGLTTLEWFDPHAGASAMFLMGVMHAVREFAFVWHEWRTEG